MREGDGVREEYDKFMEELEEFNKKLGYILSLLRVTLVREPLHGGKRLDLHKIYKSVMDNGGFETVSAEKKWKIVCQQFQFPSTATNSAFVLKQIYQRYILNYEDFKEGRATIDDLLKRVSEDERDHKRQRTSTAPTPTSIATRSKTPAKAAVGGVPQLVKRNLHSYSIFQKVPSGNPDEDGRDEKHLYGGFKSKLLLALESGLPNEVDWAYNKLVKLSFSCPATFHIGVVPGLVETLIEHLDPFFGQVTLHSKVYNFGSSVNGSNSGGSEEIALISNPQTAIIVERTLQVLHILRNFSFLEQNARHLASFEPILLVLAKGIGLPGHSQHIEIRHHCIDIIENLATHIQLRGKNDFYLACLRRMLFEDDRALVIAAVRTLTRLCILEVNQRILADIEDKDLIQRLFQLLLINDEEMINSILEYLYQYTSLGGIVARNIALVEGVNPVKILSKFLLWRGAPQPLSLPQKLLSSIQALKYVKPDPDAILGVNLTPEKPFVPPPASGAAVAPNANQAQLQQMQMFASQQLQMQQMQQMAAAQQLQMQQLAMSMRAQIPPSSSTVKPPVSSVASANPSVNGEEEGGNKTETETPPESRRDDEEGDDDEYVEDEEDEDEAYDDKDADEEFNPRRRNFSSNKIGRENKYMNYMQQRMKQTPMGMPFGQSPMEQQHLQPNTISAIQKQIAAKYYMMKQQQQQQQPGTPFRPPGAVMVPPQMATQSQLSGTPMAGRIGYGSFQTPGQPMMRPTATPMSAGMIRPPQATAPTPVPEKREEKKPELVEETVIVYECCWDHGGDEECHQVFESEEDLEQHVQDVHFPLLNTGGRYLCKWRGCTRLHSVIGPDGQSGLTSRLQALNHLTMHFPLETRSIKKVIKTVPVKPKKKVAAVNDMSMNLSGIPLTSVLVLRNIARTAYKDIESGDQIRNLLVECEGDFAVLMAIEPRFSRFVSQILGEMKEGGDDDDEM